MSAAGDLSVRAEQEAAVAPPSGDVPEWAGDEPEPPRAAGGWLAAALAILLGLAWTGAFVWANHAAMTVAASPAQWTGWITAWAGPALLIAMAWLIVMRSSQRETNRFADAAQLLGAEAALLEARLTSVNRELSLAREFLASQSRELESLGRIAADRLSQHADRLEHLIRDNGAQVEALGTVSAASLDNMEKLRNQLPVIASSAKDVTNNIGNAGRIAHSQLQDMINGLNRMNEFGMACERQVVSLRERVDAALAELAARTQDLDAAAAGRLAALSAQSATFRADLVALETEAFSALHERSAALEGALATSRGDLERTEAEGLASLRARLSALQTEAAAMSRSLREGEASALTQWQDAVAALGRQLGDLDDDIARRHAEHMAQASELGARTARTNAELAAIEERITAITAADTAAANGFADRLALLGHRLADTETALAALTDGSVRLLELIQASAEHSSGVLPNAIAAADQRLSGLETRIFSLRDTVGTAAAQGEALSGYVLAANDTLGTALGGLSALHGALDDKARAHAGTLDDLRASLAALEEGTIRLSQQARGDLTQAIDQLAVAARSAVSELETHGAATVSALAERLGTESAAAIEQAMATQASDISARLEQAATQAAGVGRDATIQLRNQLTKVDELVGNLERRVAQARERAEEQVDHDFARRVALITEALNSNAIDIARALDADVTDTAWAAYLRGDRGIFTRRAVRLLEPGEAKSVLQVYEADPSFREHVNQYIHDFEAMLRQLLSTRDGHALGVTLLSSDMGKLYVAMAQAIERLRD